MCVVFILAALEFPPKKSKSNCKLISEPGIYRATSVPSFKLNVDSWFIFTSSRWCFRPAVGFLHVQILDFLIPNRFIRYSRLSFAPLFLAGKRNRRNSTPSLIAIRPLIKMTSSMNQLAIYAPFFLYQYKISALHMRIRAQIHSKLLD